MIRSHTSHINGNRIQRTVQRSGTKRTVNSRYIVYSELCAISSRKHCPVVAVSADQGSVLLLKQPLTVQTFCCSRMSTLGTPMDPLIVNEGAAPTTWADVVSIYCCFKEKTLTHVSYALLSMVANIRSFHHTSTHDHGCFLRAFDQAHREMNGSALHLGQPSTSAAACAWVNTTLVGAWLYPHWVDLELQSQQQCNGQLGQRLFKAVCMLHHMHAICGHTI